MTRRQSTVLFIDADTYLEFKGTTSAFVYAHKNRLQSFLILRYYENSNRVSVFNPFLTDLSKVIEYFENEATALHYIGSFLQ